MSRSAAYYEYMRLNAAIRHRARQVPDNVRGDPAEARAIDRLIRLWPQLTKEEQYAVDAYDEWMWEEGQRQAAMATGSQPTSRTIAQAP